MNKLKILGTCIIILSIALLLSKWLINTAPNAESQRPQRQALLVEAQTVSYTHLTLPTKRIV